MAGLGRLVKRLGYIGLRMGISTTFIVLVVPLIFAIVGYIYASSANLARDQATRDMDRITGDIVDEVQSLLNPVQRVVEGLSVQAKIDQRGMRRVDGLGFVMDQVANLPQAYGLYIGFDRDGGFYQVIHPPKGLPSFGAEGKPLPDNANYVLRLLDASSGAMADSYLYLASWGDIIRVERGPAHYDPRTRPWYKAVWESKDAVISDVYPFSSTGKPGLTISHRVESDDGVRIGVVGADISLDVLSDFLRKKAIGQNGRVFIIDGDGKLIVHPEPGMGVSLSDGKVALKDAKDVSDSVVADAVSLRAAGRGDRFTARIGPDKLRYMVSFAPFPDQLQKNWVIGVAVVEDEFIGPFRRLSTHMLIVGLVVSVILVAAIMFLANWLTKPIRATVLETERIREFNLDGDFNVNSQISEINELTHAMAAMKSSLRSFGAYVPKALVRNIVSSGASTTVGGERKFLTVMFTDIREFTRTSDALSPEEISSNLSDYFREMSAAIHHNKGIIDKFIGDAIMALWNTPVADADHVPNACRAMLACRDISNHLNDSMAARGGMSLYTRLGLHCGHMMVGNVGSPDRMQYTVLGSAVNLAARLEGLNKYYGTQLLVSGAVYDIAKEDFIFRLVDRVVPSGVSEPVDIYELLTDRLAEDSQANLEKVERWGLIMALYRAQDWDAAMDACAAFLSTYRDDGPAKLYLTRCADFKETPPPSDWNCATYFEKK